MRELTSSTKTRLNPRAPIKQHDRTRHKDTKTPINNDKTLACRSTAFLTAVNCARATAEEAEFNAKGFDTASQALLFDLQPSEASIDGRNASICTLPSL